MLPRVSPPLKAVVAAYPLLELGCYFLTTAITRPLLDPAFGHGNLYYARLLVHADGVERNEGRLSIRAAYLYAEVLGTTALVHEDLVDLSYPSAGGVVDLVSCKLLLKVRKSLFTLLVFHLLPPPQSPAPVARTYGHSRSWVRFPSQPPSAAASP